MKLFVFCVWWIKFCLMSSVIVLCVVMCDMLSVLDNICLEGSVLLVV